MVLHIVPENDKAEQKEAQHQQLLLEVFKRCDQALQRKRMRVGGGNLVNKLR